MTVVVDYDFRDEFPVTLPAHQWQLLLAASETEMRKCGESGQGYGLAQAFHEIAIQWRLARVAARTRRWRETHPSQPSY